MAQPPKTFTVHAGSNESTNWFRDSNIDKHWYVRTLRIDGGGWVIDSLRAEVCHLKSGRATNCKWNALRGKSSQARPRFFARRGTGSVQEISAPDGGCIGAVQGYADRKFVSQISVTTVHADGRTHAKKTFGGLSYDSGDRRHFSSDFKGGCLLSTEGWHHEYINKIGFVYGARYDSQLDTVARWKNG